MRTILLIVLLLLLVGSCGPLALTDAKQVSVDFGIENRNERR